ncbi:MAG: hypothetical protein JW749_10815 [Sedimentisphaerales bacterium]|nr:hypothetical protein [Sedimentisphaerales bacterium]
MTIQFKCPKCGSLIAFADRHAGKPAKCLTCGQKLIIPQKSEQAPQTIEPPQEPEAPLTGFYRAVFFESWKIFFDRDNLTGLVFVAAAVCFKFFTAGSCCLGLFVYLAAWGYLFGFYLKIICETALGNDKFPEIDVGTGIDFAWYMLKPILVFGATLFVVELPFYAAAWLFGRGDATLQSLRQRGDMTDWFLISLFAAGLILFPLAILKVSMMEEITSLLELKRFFTPVIRAFFPYLTVVAILALACYMETVTEQYAPMARETAGTITGKLSMNLLEQVVAIISMRTIGLFYRHFGCFFGY